MRRAAFRLWLNTWIFPCDITFLSAEETMRMHGLTRRYLRYNGAFKGARNALP